MFKKYIVILVVLLSGCGGGGGGGGSSSPTSNPSPNPTSLLTVDLSEAVAVTAAPLSSGNSLANSMISKESSDSKPLIKVKEDGSLEVCMHTTDGTYSPNIRRIIPGPDDNIYMVMEEPIRTMSDDSRLYTILKVSQSGDITGIDSETWVLNNWPFRDPLNWGPNGEMYYIGLSPRDNKHILRKYYNNTITSVSPTDEYVLKFVVTSTGGLLYEVAGDYSNDTLNYVSSNGAVTSIPLTNQSTMMKIFPDGNVYIAVDWNLYKFNEDTKELEPSDLFDVVDSPNMGGIYEFSEHSGKLYAIDQDNQCYQVYPSTKKVFTSLSTITAMATSETKLYVAGVDSHGTNRIFECNTSEDSEIEVNYGHDIAVKHMQYSEGNGRRSGKGKKLFFDGVNKENNKHIAGSYDIDSNNTTINSMGSGDAADIVLLN